MIHMIESQLNYIADYLATLDRTGAAALDTRAGAQQAWCDDIERRMASTVWTTGGCVSWYLNAAGRNPTLWPGSTIGFRRATRRLDPAEYELIPEAVGRRACSLGKENSGHLRMPTQRRRARRPRCAARCPGRAGGGAGP